MKMHKKHKTVSDIHSIPFVGVLASCRKRPNVSIEYLLGQRRDDFEFCLHGTEVGVITHAAAPGVC